MTYEEMQIQEAAKKQTNVKRTNITIDLPVDAMNQVEKRQQEHIFTKQYETNRSHAYTSPKIGRQCRPMRVRSQNNRPSTTNFSFRSLSRTSTDFMPKIVRKNDIRMRELIYQQQILASEEQAESTTASSDANYYPAENEKASEEAETRDKY